MPESLILLVTVFIFTMFSLSLPLSITRTSLISSMSKKAKCLCALQRHVPGSSNGRRSNSSGLYNLEGDIERRTYRWVLEIVYGMGLCPWSGTVLRKPGKGEAPRLLVKSDPNIDITRKGLKHFGTIFMKQCEELVVKKNGSTLLVCPTLDDFSDFMAVAEFAEELLEQSGMDEQVQIATFHPDYLFEGEDESTSLTNKSPYPVLHLLRVEDVREAIDSYEIDGKSTEDIWKKNKIFVQKQGNQIRLLLEKILSDI